MKTKNWIRVVLWNVYKRKAAQRGYRWTLSKKQFFSLIKKKCFYCKSSLSNLFVVPCKSGRYKYSMPYNGIDRKDNKQGYVVSNVVACCKYCNKAKNTMDLKDFKKWLDRIKKYW